jgi:hypothetical protein
MTIAPFGGDRIRLIPVSGLAAFPHPRDSSLPGDFFLFFPHLPLTAPTAGKSGGPIPQVFLPQRISALVLPARFPERIRRENIFLKK